MNKYNKIDCCFDCEKQFNYDLCDSYCKNKCHKPNACDPGECQDFVRKGSDCKEIVTNKNLHNLITDFKNENEEIGIKKFDELFKVITKKEYEELLEYKKMYLGLCK